MKTYELERYDIPERNYYYLTSNNDSNSDFSSLKD